MICYFFFYFLEYLERQSQNMKKQEKMKKRKKFRKKSQKSIFEKIGKQKILEKKILKDVTRNMDIAFIIN